MNVRNLLACIPFLKEEETKQNKTKKAKAKARKNENLETTEAEKVGDGGKITSSFT